MYVNICLYPYQYPYIYSNICVQIYVYIHIYTYKNMYTNICIYIYRYIFIYMYIHIYMHTLDVCRSNKHTHNVRPYRYMHVCKHQGPRYFCMYVGVWRGSVGMHSVGTPHMSSAQKPVCANTRAYSHVSARRGCVGVWVYIRWADHT